MENLIVCLSAVLLIAPVVFAEVPRPGPEHAIVLINKGQYQNAVNLLETLLREAELNGTPADVKAAMNANLGTAYHKLGRNADAEKALVKSIRLWTDLGWTNRLEYGISMNNLGDALLAEKFYAKAEENFRAALAVFRGLSQPPPPEMAVALNNLAMIAQSGNKMDDAERYYQQALEVLHDPAQQATVQFAGILNNLGFLYKVEKRFSEARDLYVRALEIWEAKIGKSHPDIAFGLHNLAVLETELNQTAEAERHLSSALELAQRTLPPEHPIFSAIYLAWEQLYRKTGRKQEAKQFAAQAKASNKRHAQVNYGNTTVDVRTLLR